MTILYILLARISNFHLLLDIISFYRITLNMRIKLLTSHYNILRSKLYKMEILFAADKRLIPF